MTSSVGTEGQTGGQPLGQQAEFLADKMAEVRREISKAIVGQLEVVDGVLIALLAGGHVLLEGCRSAAGGPIGIHGRSDEAEEEISVIE